MTRIANRATIFLFALAAAVLSSGCYTTGPYAYGSSSLASDYYAVGDPAPLGYGSSVYAYFGHHSHANYFDSYCTISGRHHHDYRPHHGHSYRIDSGVYHYTGVFGRGYRHRDDHRDRDRRSGEYHHRDGKQNRHPDSKDKQQVVRRDDHPRENWQRKQQEQRFHTRRNELREKTHPAPNRDDRREPRTRARRDSRRSERDRARVVRVSGKLHPRDHSRRQINPAASERRQHGVRSADEREPQRTAAKARRNERRPHKKKSEIEADRRDHRDKRARRTRKGTR